MLNIRKHQSLRIEKRSATGVRSREKKKTTKLTSRFSIYPIIGKSISCYRSKIKASRCDGEEEKDGGTGGEGGGEGLSRDM